MKKNKYLITLAIALAIMATGRIYLPVAAADAPPLGTSTGFAVLAATTATSTGLTVVTGDMGVVSGTTPTGFPPGVHNGTLYTGGAVALQAQADSNVAYGILAGLACDVDLTGTDLGGLTLNDGVHCFSSSAQLTGQLVLDAQGNPDAVFIIQIGSTLTTATDASVSVINGANICNVYWQVGSSATLGTNTAFGGNLIALASVTLTTDSSVAGRVHALTGAVTMDTNHISKELCDDPAAVALNTVSASATGAPGLFGLLAVCLLATTVVVMRRRNWQGPVSTD